MRVEVEVGGRTRVVTVERRGAELVATLDGARVELDVARIGPGRYSFRSPATGKQHDVRVSSVGSGRHDVTVDGTAVVVTRQTGRHRGARAGGGDGPSRVTAPMPGKVVRVLVSAGDDVVVRQGLVVVEAMKMENELRAGRAGRVREVLVAEGASVEAGAPLVVIE